ncbi:MAG: RimK/LysX family protein [Bacteroidia bacterium]|nr:RimK/LysX family protein [Bacteroidia bacterium]MDW8303071.1 RimK/LysX family protein [Bacteroidia bacterium]
MEEIFKPPKKIKIGWLEEIELPEFNIKAITAKIDTGAYTSSLHATKIRPFLKEGVSYVQFYANGEVKCIKPVHSQRVVKSSNGHEELRIVIETVVVLGKRKILTEFTLADRKDMDYRVLLGRKFLQKRYIVDVSKTFRIKKLQLKKQKSRDAKKT